MTRAVRLITLLYGEGGKPTVVLPSGEQLLWLKDALFCWLVSLKSPRLFIVLKSSSCLFCSTGFSVLFISATVVSSYLIVVTYVSRGN